MLHLVFIYEIYAIYIYDTFMREISFLHYLYDEMESKNKAIKLFRTLLVVEKRKNKTCQQVTISGKFSTEVRRAGLRSFPGKSSRRPLRALAVFTYLRISREISIYITAPCEQKYETSQLAVRCANNFQLSASATWQWKPSAESAL